MVQHQVSTLVGGDTIVDPGFQNTLSNDGGSNISAAVFAATKDLKSLKAAVKTLAGIMPSYSDSYMDSMTENDLVFAVTSNQAAITAAATITAWAATTAYVVGNRVTNTAKTLQCIKAGTSGATLPTNPGTGLTVADGTVTWIQLN